MSAQSEVWTVVVAAGSGQRFGGPKHLATLGPERVIDRAVAGARSVSDAVVVVVAADRLDEMAASLPDDVRCVAGGATRSASVRAGLAAVPEDGVGVILVHDGARPLASPAVYERVVAAVRAGAHAVVPGVPVTDTIRHRRGGVVDRDELVAVQTPQGFDPGALRAAHRPGADASDDAALVEAAGGMVEVVDGDPENIKITHPGDLEYARARLR